MARPVFVFLVFAYLQSIPGTGTDGVAHAWEQEPGSATSVATSSSANSPSTANPATANPATANPSTEDLSAASLNAAGQSVRPNVTESATPSMRGVDGGTTAVENSAVDTGNSAVVSTSETEPASTNPKRNGAPTKSFIEELFSNPLNFALLLVVFVYIALMFMGPRNLRKEQQQHAERLKNLKKNDRVITSAGIHGIVANIQSDAETITLRIDENTNTKITIDKASIRSIVSQS